MAGHLGVRDQPRDHLSRSLFNVTEAHLTNELCSNRSEPRLGEDRLAVVGVIRERGIRPDGEADALGTPMQLGPAGAG